VIRDVAVVAFAQSEHSFSDLGWTEADLVMPLVNEVLGATGLRRSEIGFTCSGSNDYLVGTPFSFVAALDTIGAWPPIAESHVEQDAAWALYEAWIRIQHGDVDTALVYGFGKGTVGDYAGISSLSYDPYYVAPLMPGDIGMAGLQARALKDAGFDVDPDPTPPPPTDGAAAVILAAGDVARRVCARPAWITGIDHRIEPHSLGTRDLTRSESARQAALRAGVSAGPVEFAELHTRFEHEEPLLRRELGLSEDTVVNASGGPRKADPIMATGLIRIGEAAARIHDGAARRTVAHATAGPCLQHNLVCVLEAREAPEEARAAAEDGAGHGAKVGTGDSTRHDAEAGKD
jgi:acetyl-CoA acetyltransferase